MLLVIDTNIIVSADLPEEERESILKQFTSQVANAV